MQSKRIERIVRAALTFHLDGGHIYVGEGDVPTDNLTVAISTQRPPQFVSISMTRAEMAEFGRTLTAFAEDSA